MSVCKYMVCHQNTEQFFTGTGKLLPGTIHVRRTRGNETPKHFLSSCILLNFSMVQQFGSVCKLSCRSLKVSSAIRVYVFRITSLICESLETVSECISINRLHDSKVETVYCYAGKQHTPTLELLPTLLHNDGAEEVNTTI